MANDLGTAPSRDLRSQLAQAPQMSNSWIADFVTGNPCSAPCWYGLQLNKSTEADVYSTLKKLDFVDQTSIGEWSVTWLNDADAKEIFYSCLYPNEKGCGSCSSISEQIEIFANDNPLPINGRNGCAETGRAELHFSPSRSS